MIDIKNPNYYQQLLDNSNFSADTRKFVQGVINTIISSGNKATDRQNAILQRLKAGDFKYPNKN